LVEVAAERDLGVVVEPGVEGEDEVFEVEETVEDVSLEVEVGAADDTSENGLVKPPDEEDEDVVVLEPPGRSPPLVNALSVDVPVKIELVEVVDCAIAVTDVEVTSVVDVVDAAAIEVVAATEELVLVVVVVVELVEPPRPPPGDSVDVVISTAGVNGFCPSPTLIDAAAPVTETAKASTALIEGPAGIQFSIPGY